TQIPLLPGHLSSVYRAQGETIEYLLLHMTRPVDGFLDNSAAYVALSRATCLERLFLVAAITLSDIQCKPKPDLSAALAWLDKLDAASQSAFFRDPSTFSPVVVSSPH
ncbi:unnamed protein product, partial [Pylaiella littoralis]